MKPKDRIREIAERLQAVFMTPTRGDQIVAIREWDRRSVQDGAWLLEREKGLRVRLQQAVKKIAELEAGAREGEKLGVRSPVVRPPSLAEEAAELRQLSKEVALKEAMDDAFGLIEEDEYSEWFDTEDGLVVVRPDKKS